MHSRVTLLEIDTLRTDIAGALAVFKEEVLPQLRQQPGYAGIFVMSTPDGKGLLMSLWDSEEAAEASATTGFYAEALERHMVLFRSPPGRERYQVLFAESPAMAPG